MREPLVYLAGPITGLSYQGASDWRVYARKFLEFSGIVAISPMRGQDHLLQETTIQDTYDHKIMSTQRAIMHRSEYDTHRADALLVNLIGAKKVSIGTVMELAWAHHAKKPIVCAMEDEDLFHEHCMIREALTYRVSNLDDALSLVQTTVTY